jgi:hypothetical protein
MLKFTTVVVMYGASKLRGRQGWPIQVIGIYHMLPGVSGMPDLMSSTIDWVLLLKRFKAIFILYGLLPSFHASLNGFICFDLTSNGFNVF